jgi:exonuclease III
MPLKIIAFNINGIAWQRYELSKRLQDIHMDVALLSETHLIQQARFFIPNYHFYRTDCFRGRKGGTAVAVRKGIPNKHVDLPLLVSIEVTGICIPMGKREVLNAKHPLRNSVASKASGVKLLNLLHINEFQISAHQYYTH